ncbi:hypothetical protein [Cryptosporidium parvum Iowa II]|uniref:Uncharacterized protein n=3 Tax=Cryptosporidium parvum TaxID=5807 RepID=A0A7S7LFS2_CRYPV|nr:hypothetical protein [Cryptosporidium parvum Iowa II]EAK87342.1 hypothetical, possible apicomplexan-specific protein [Cryptosporidium parvum Iowa II]QOY40896.1 Uncharacterized protein CPATCC_0011640 [Cryptosporidium parvum]WKS78127.1 hypothetical protein CPCDC_6g160 [Cryptosporidium sp. 43IA8]WRK32615.1 Uncharacterized protein cpbgf_600160 [Cryptosporidium parvum]|eukprot:QOY40896.1 hypothetical protein CPATCC_002511 [Cryptosporidium parvum]
MSDISCILYSGIYEVLVEYLDYEDVYELALLSVEWGNYLGGTFIRYWKRASTHIFGLRFDLIRVLTDKMFMDTKDKEFENIIHSRNIKSWFEYFEFLTTSELRTLLINQKKMNKVLHDLLVKLKVELNPTNSYFSIQNSSNFEGNIGFNKFIQDYTRNISEALTYPFRPINKQNSKDHINSKDTNSTEFTSFNRIELDFGGLGKGYLWDMEITSITSQNIILKSEFQIEDIPYWDIGQLMIEYIAVWGIINEDDHLLLYHHKNPFHKTDDRIHQNSNNYQTLILEHGTKISNLNGINYFLSSLSSFAGIEMSINEQLSRITIYITLQVVFILENLKNHFSSNTKSFLYSNKQTKSIQDSERCNIIDNFQFKENIHTCSNTVEYIEENYMHLEDYHLSTEKYNSKEDSDFNLLDIECEYDNISTQESLFLSEDEFDPFEGNLTLLPSSSVSSYKDHLESNPSIEKQTKYWVPSFLSFKPKFMYSIPFKCNENKYSRSYYNIELQLMDTRASIPLYLYGDLEPFIESKSMDFVELRVYFGRNYPNSSFIKTNCLYQAGISVIDKTNGEIVFSLVFPKSKSFYDRRVVSSKSKRLLKLCSYSRVYSTQVPVVDPPSQLTNMPESVFSKLEILIHPQKSTVGKVSELSISLNVKECLALFPIKKFKRFLRLQGFQSQDQYKRKINSPIKNIHKY